MKKSIMKVLYICSMFFLFYSCEQENEIKTTETPKDGIATFHATISKTRTTGNNWDKEDSIGIYALTGGDSIPGGIFDEKANIKYETKDGSGFFTAVDTDIMLPSGGTYDFVAYYPYQSDMTNNIYQIDISNQANQGDIDLLYSDNAKEHTYTNPNANLKFNHMLSMVTLNISAGDDVTSLVNATVEIRNTSTMGTFNLSSKEISITKDSIATITPNINCTKEKATVSAILLPGQEFSETTVVITIAGKDLEWTPQQKLLLSGKNYLYNIKVTTQGTLETDAAEIIDWDNETVEEDIDFIVKPGDDNNAGGGELLFAGADFDFKTTDELNIINKAKPGYIIKLNTNTGKYDNKSLHITESNIMKRDIFITSIEENKIKGKNNYISFYIKGDSPDGIMISLSYTDKINENQAIMFNINDDTLKKQIINKNDEFFHGVISPIDNWQKVYLNIGDLDSISKSKVNEFRIKLNSNPGMYNLFIDYITVE